MFEISPELAEQRSKLLASCKDEFEALDKEAMLEDDLATFKAECEFRNKIREANAKKTSLCVSLQPDYLSCMIASEIDNVSQDDFVLLKHLKSIETKCNEKELTRRITLTFNVNPIISDTELWIELKGLGPSTTYSSSGVNFTAEAAPAVTKSKKRAKTDESPYQFFRAFSESSIEYLYFFTQLSSIEINQATEGDDEEDEEMEEESED
eukprot:TRINITY_DN21534_c0_g1_i1.p1 TRINITY_DN21534_c0_g1~~TRINITY_DN21534_c0_g1_i1.p1  ORF type:complete len:209 (+),score=53.06 TRINITY_DN21534_c0_g1_i1:40-666(+)